MALSLLYRAIRPLAWAPFFIGYLLGVGCGNATLNPKAWIGCVAVAFGCISGVAMNNYVDRNLDKNAIGKDIDLKRNPWATGELAFRHMLALSVVPTILMLTTSYTISPLFLTLNILSWFAGTICYSYPLYLKGKAPFDIICMPVATFIFPFLAGYWLNSLLEFPVLPIMLCFVFGTDIFIASEVWDIDADRYAGLKTTAVILGRLNAKRTRRFLKFAQVAIATIIIVSYPLTWKILAAGITLTTLIPSCKYLKLQWVSFTLLVVVMLLQGLLF